MQQLNKKIIVKDIAHKYRCVTCEGPLLNYNKKNGEEFICGHCGRYYTKKVADGTCKVVLENDIKKEIDALRERIKEAEGKMDVLERKLELCEG